MCTEFKVVDASKEVEKDSNGVPKDFEIHKETFYAPFVNHGDHLHRLQLRDNDGNLYDAPAYSREYAEARYASLLTEFCIRDEENNPNTEYSCIEVTLEAVPV